MEYNNIAYAYTEYILLFLALFHIGILFNIAYFSYIFASAFKQFI